MGLRTAAVQAPTKYSDPLQRFPFQNGLGSGCSAAACTVQAPTKYSGPLQHLHFQNGLGSGLSQTVQVGLLLLTNWQGLLDQATSGLLHYVHILYNNKKEPAATHKSEHTRHPVAAARDLDP